MIVRDLLFRLIWGIKPSLDGWSNWEPTLTAFLVTVVLAEISWHFLEKPIIAWSKSAPSHGNLHG
jgi:peptidoglycan/LPS O-acetylase OafA/YrhL